VLQAQGHRDYPKLNAEAQLLFIARYIAGAGVASPDYALKMTRNLPDLNRKKKPRVTDLPG
jgi:hypothetical protein